MDDGFLFGFIKILDNLVDMRTEPLWRLNSFLAPIEHIVKFRPSFPDGIVQLINYELVIGGFFELQPSGMM